MKSSPDIETLLKMGVKIPQLLFPKELDTYTWATIACDQFTQNREYWSKVYETVGEKPSTVKITFPEVYLGDPGKEERIKNINKEMQSYMMGGVFGPSEDEMIYLERTTAYGRVRHGLLTCIDLESYEWKPFSKAKIRATEATLVERLPPRMEIRRGACIEIPHIMLLVNDPEHVLVEGIGEKVKGKPTRYSGPLMQNSGSIKGWAVKTPDEIAYVTKAVQKIAKNNTNKNGDVFLFAVGDGNHSLATAKAIWDEYKRNHPKVTDGKLRYALIEIVNIYDTGLTFEPIHRCLFKLNIEDFIKTLAGNLKGKLLPMSSFEDMVHNVENSKANFGFTFTKEGNTQFMLLQTGITDLPISVLQPAIDDYLKANRPDDMKQCIDFIHGTDETLRLGKQEGCVSVLLPPINKDSFFSTIDGRGPLPRKSFSMGEADEKRFYLECRKIVA